MLKVVKTGMQIYHFYLSDFLLSCFLMQHWHFVRGCCQSHTPCCNLCRLLLTALQYRDLLLNRVEEQDDSECRCVQGMVFDYYVDDATCSMVPWEGKVPSFSYMPDSFSSLFVPTVDTTRLTYFLDNLIAKKHYVMFVGNTGDLILRATLADAIFLVV